MLKLTCDHCGFEIQLIHKLVPRQENVYGSDARLFWEVDNEQDGIGYSSGGKHFDREPNELEKWIWIDGMGKTDPDYLGGHYCQACKEEFREYIKKYQAAEVDLENFCGISIVTDQVRLRATVKELDEKMKQHRREYVEAFRKKATQ